MRLTTFTCDGCGAPATTVYTITGLTPESRFSIAQVLAMSDEEYAAEFGDGDDLCAYCDQCRAEKDD